jgi:hypothetical protein
MAHITKEKMKLFYKAERRRHIALVNEFAKKLGLSFPKHDADKIVEPLLSEFAPFSWCYHNSLPVRYKKWIHLREIASNRHKTASAHHPEHWKNIADMTEIAIMEMCCDWSAANMDARQHEEFSSAMDFYKKFALKEYKFTKNQQKLIVSLLKKLNGRPILTFAK